MDGIEWDRGVTNSSSYVNSSFDQHRGEVSKFAMTFDLKSTA